MPRNAAPLPWDGKAERADLILMGGIVFSGLYLLALMPLTPSMVYDHPVILELLKGSMDGDDHDGRQGADRRGVAARRGRWPRSPA